MADNRLLLDTKIIMNLILGRTTKVVNEIKDEFSAEQFIKGALNSITPLNTAEFENSTIQQTIKLVEKQLKEHDKNKIILPSNH